MSSRKHISSLAAGILCSLFLVSLAHAVPFGNSLDNDLRAYYSFTGNANDDSGNGHDGTLFGPTLPSLSNDRFGSTDSAYSFGGNGYIGTDLFVGNDNFIAFWMKTSTNNQLIMGPTDGQFYTWMFGVDAAGDVFYGDYKTNYGGHVTISGNNVTDNAWHHIAVFQDEATASLFLFQDGALVASYTEAGLFDSWGAGNDAGFGFVSNWTTADGVYPGIATYYTGSLDDIGFWGRELTSDELQQLSGSTVPEPATLALLGLGLLGIGFARKKQ
ncbi:MAG: LamG domain-containing protein [Chromatiales bacterium]